MLELGADPARENALGMTPLGVAIAHDSREVARVLTVAMSGASEARDSTGRSAVDVALDSSPTQARCRAMLRALAVRSDRRRRKLCSHAADQRVARKRLQEAQPAATRIADGGGGWDAPTAGDATDASTAASGSSSRSCDFE
eukprot:5510380-Prymnesium_polylepis.1